MTTAFSDAAKHGMYHFQQELMVSKMVRSSIACMCLACLRATQVAYATYRVKRRLRTHHLGLY